jgi:hypothetical protein
VLEQSRIPQEMQVLVVHRII